ncbi:MAG: ribbon-helix-helix domain-containing protein [Cetobacterium sp.]
MATKNISITLPEKVAEKLKEESKEKFIPVSNMITKLVVEMLKKEGKW